MLLQIDVAPIVQRWGAWGVLLIAFGLFVWRWVLPRIDRSIEQRRKDREAERENLRKRDERFVQMISDNLESAQRGRELERDKFLEVVDGTLQKQTTVLAKLVETVDEKLK